MGGHIGGALAGRGAPKKVFIFQIETLKRLKFSDGRQVLRVPGGLDTKAFVSLVSEE